MQKIYYKLTFLQTAPLSISNGDDKKTDRDLMIDSRGLPFIPGSSVAGVLRSLVTEEDGNNLFGYIKTDGSIQKESGTQKENNTQKESSVMISDAVLPRSFTRENVSDENMPGENTLDKMIHITCRDGIGLNERGTALKGAKFNFETVEIRMPEEREDSSVYFSAQKRSGEKRIPPKNPIVYTSVLEWTGDLKDSNTANQMGILCGILDRILAEGVAFGARTSRGYGAMNVSVQEKRFDFPEDLDAWLDFDPFSEDAQWEDYRGRDFAKKDEISGLTIEAGIQIQGSFAVRKYKETLPGEEGKPSAVPLQSANGKPVIPGTSWAGAFRHHMLKLARQIGKPESVKDEINRLFGVVNDGRKKSKSRLYFNETVIDGGSSYVITRNALDRFTAAPVSQALYTAQWWQGGKGTLRIQCKDRKDISLLMGHLLAAALVDLNLGLLTVGGSAGTGHGCIKIASLKVNGQDRKKMLDDMETTFLEVK